MRQPTRARRPPPEPVPLRLAVGSGKRAPNKKGIRILVWDDS